MSITLGLDLGTTSLSAIAIRDDGEVLKTVHVPNESAISGLPSGHAEQDPQRLRGSAISALRQLSAALPEKPQCLGLTGQMHGVLLLDDRQEPLTNLITWQDRRANEPVDGDGPTLLEEYLSLASGEELLQTGCRLSPGYMAVTLFAMKRRGEISSRVSLATFLADWIAAELCETNVVTDRSNAASSGVFNLAQDRWSSSLIDAGGLNEEWFPPVRESSEVVGHVTKRMADETRLPVGLPVCNAIGDNQAAVLGSVPAGDPAIQINVGTGGQINWPIDTFVRANGMDTRYLPQHRFMLVGAGLAGGDAYAWVNRIACQWLKELGFEPDEAAVYDRITRLAATVPEDGAGLSCEPLFRGTRQRPQARGTFAGITPDNFSLGHVSRAVLQGIAQGMYSFYENSADLKPAHLTRIIGSGNGLRRNPVLARIIATTFQRQLWFPAHTEEAAFGAALLAGVATNLWPDLAEAGNYIHLISAENL